MGVEDTAKRGKTWTTECCIHLLSTLGYLLSSNLHNTNNCSYSSITTIYDTHELLPLQHSTKLWNNVSLSVDINERDWQSLCKGSRLENVEVVFSKELLRSSQWNLTFAVEVGQVKLSKGTVWRWMYVCLTVGVRRLPQETATIAYLPSEHWGFYSKRLRSLSSRGAFVLHILAILE